MAEVQRQPRRPLGAHVRGFAALVVVRELARGNALDRELDRLARAGVDARWVREVRLAMDDLRQAADEFTAWHATWPEPTNQAEPSQPLPSSTHITTGEAAEMLGNCSPEWVRQLVKSERLLGFKSGRTWFVERASVELWRAGGAA